MTVQEYNDIFKGCKNKNYKEKYEAKYTTDTIIRNITEHGIRGVIIYIVYFTLFAEIFVFCLFFFRDIYIIKMSILVAIILFTFIIYLILLRGRKEGKLWSEHQKEVQFKNYPKYIEGLKLWIGEKIKKEPSEKDIDTLISFNTLKMNKHNQPTKLLEYFSIGLGIISFILQDTTSSIQHSQEGMISSTESTKTFSILILMLFILSIIIWLISDLFSYEHRRTVKLAEDLIYLKSVI